MAAQGLHGGVEAVEHHEEAEHPHTDQDEHLQVLVVILDDPVEVGPLLCGQGLLRLERQKSGT